MTTYRIEGLKIIGPDNKPFIPVGVNMATFDSDGGLGSGNKTHLQVSADALKHWDCNTVRLVSYVTTRSSWSARNKATGYNGAAPGFASVVAISKRATDMYRANGIVVMLEAHDFTASPAANDTQANIDKWHGEIVEYWTAMANLYKNDSGVWFNLYNEPSMIDADYVARHDACIAAIRGAGANNIIVIDAPRWGQDIPTSGQKMGIEPDMVPSLVSKWNGGILYSHHHYGSNNGWYGTQYTLNKYLDRVAAAGLPLVFGEIGWERAPGWNTSWSNCRNAGILTMQEAPKRGIGVLWWAGAHNDEYDLHYDPVQNRACEIWDTKTTTLPLSDGGEHFKKYTLRQAGKLVGQVNFVPPSGLGRLTKAAIAANTDGLSDAIQALGGGAIPRDQVTVNSPAKDVQPYLPPQAAIANGRVRSQTKIYIDASTQYPIRATWTEDSTLKLVIQNPATNTSDLNVGYGVYGTDNHTTEPDVVPPGSEWVGYSSPLPVYCRFTTGTGHIDVITERSA